MKGTIGALKFNILEQMVEFEETMIHPLVNCATNFTQFALAHPLTLADNVLESYKFFLGLNQTLFDLPLTGAKDINMLTPRRQLEFLHHTTQEIEPMKLALPFRVEWEDERAIMLTCDMNNEVIDNPVIIFVA